MFLNNMFSSIDFKILLMSALLVLALQYFTYRLSQWIRYQFHDKYWIHLTIVVIMIVLPFLFIDNLSTWIGLSSDLHFLRFPKVQLLVIYEVLILASVWTMVELDLTKSFKQKS